MDEAPRPRRKASTAPIGLTVDELGAEVTEPPTSASEGDHQASPTGPPSEDSLSRIAGALERITAVLEAAFPTRAVEGGPRPQGALEDSLADIAVAIRDLG